VSVADRVHGANTGAFDTGDPCPEQRRCGNLSGNHYTCCERLADECTGGASPAAGVPSSAGVNEGTLARGGGEVEGCDVRVAGNCGIPQSGMRPSARAHRRRRRCGAFHVDIGGSELALTKRRCKRCHIPPPQRWLASPGSGATAEFDRKAKDTPTGRLSASATQQRPRARPGTAIAQPPCTTRAQISASGRAQSRRPPSCRPWLAVRPEPRSVHRWRRASHVRPANVVPARAGRRDPPGRDRTGIAPQRSERASRSTRPAPAPVIEPMCPS
jgi:hypothetical protein